MKIPVYIVTGFLGSGKTTLLKRVIDAYSGSQKIGVVQNEFAPSGFDGKELRRQTNGDFSLLEINNGSVFCVCLLSGFIRSLRQFAAERKPEMIVIEASGLSDPIAVGEIFNSPELQDNFFLAGVVCIIDASTFMKMEKVQLRIRRQAAAADVLILNKTDLNNNPAIEKRIREINPQCRLFHSTFSRIPLDDIFTKSAHRESHPLNDKEGLGRPDVKSAVFKTSRPLRAERAETFIAELASRSLRVKGYLVLDNGSCLAIQGVDGKALTEKIDPIQRQTELVVMSYGLSPKDVSGMFRDLNFTAEPGASS